MSIALFFLLAIAVAGVIVYPLLPGQRSAQLAPAVTDAEIEQAVGRLRRAQREGGLSCPTCGAPYQAGDRFCIRCGSTLAQAQSGSQEAGEGSAHTESVTSVCPSCGAALREGDQFCGKCGRAIGAREVA
jgi:predicted amidophosphoribosyltransferase